jgi:heat shock protein HtpX
MQAALRTIALFAALMGLFMVIGYVIGASFFSDPILGLLIFLGLAGLMNAISFFFSSKIVLWSYKAKIVTRNEQPRLYNIVNKICLKADLPMPKIAIVPTQTPNAFATGRNKKNAVVAATQGILSLLSDDELEGVLAHEMAHVKDKDILVMSIAATIAGAISFAARMFLWNSILGGGRGRGNDNWILLIVGAITAPLAAMLLQLAISRNREYKADYEGAMMIQKPLALARALGKLEEGNRRKPLTSGSPASASLFIVNPLRGRGLITIFMTHPPIEKRIKRLRKLADETGFLG